MQGDAPSAFMVARRARSTSLSFDRNASLASKAGVPSPPLVHPAPQYVAISAATQLISASYGVNPLEPKEGKPSNTIVTPPSLVLVNGFLDHILFNILLAAKSTKLSAIRPAVSDVLKPRLARAVVSAADEELSEYMGTSDEEELAEFRGNQDPAGHFELERSWKLTRLRCMVYARLGDMEEDDEEEHLQREGLNENNGRPYRFVNHVGLLTPAAAIFLTSILEYVAENILIIAGENSSTRLGFTNEDDERKYQGGPLVVDDVDVEKIALNPTLGRLWRTWRKNLRAPMLSRTLSRESLVQRGCTSRNSTRSSVGTVDTFDGFSVNRKFASDPPVSENPELINPAEVPLPINEYDIDEIEMPGFTSQLAVALPARSMRPRSLFISSSDICSTPASTRSSSPRVKASPRSNSKKSHSRSQSLPQSMYVSPTFPSPTRTKRSASSAAESHDEHEILESMPEAEEPETEESREGEQQAGPDSTPELNNNQHYRPAIARKMNRHYSLEADVSPPGSEIDDTNSVVSSLHTGHEMSRLYSNESAESARVPQESGHSARITTWDDIADGNPAYYSSSSLTDDEQPSSVYRARERKSSRSRMAPAPPTSHPQEDMSSTQGTIVETSFISHSSRSTSQGPRLTPLAEVADSTPVQEQHPSIQTQQLADQVSISGDSERSATPRSRPWLTKINTNCSTRTAPSVSPGSERAAVQRVTPPPCSISRDSSKLRRSESTGSRREGRPITSGSGVSQGSSRIIKGLSSRQPSDLSVSVRGSSDGSGNGSTALEDLLKSDETIHYTLTPRNMREMEEAGSPRWAATRPDLTDSFDTSSIISGKHSRKTVTPSLRSPSKSPSTQSPLARNPPSPPPKTKLTAPQARDARADNTSVRDFANFIRSTGPDQGLHPATAQGNNNVRIAKSLPNSPATTGSFSPSMLAPPRASRDTTPGTRNRPRLEARPAVLVRDNRTSELIDFIREGPPDPQARRLQQKTVAPFRDTMNSDDFRSFTPTRTDTVTGESSMPSTQDGSMVAKSVASVNSRTALIDTTNRSSSRAHQPIRPSPTSNPRGKEGSAPAKTRRRVKDPYAIDSDSEDDYDDQIESTKPKEESLAEFLRNAPPPPPPQKPQPFSINVPKTDVKRQKSMRTRIMRSATLDSNSRDSPRSSTATPPPIPRLVDLPSQHTHPGKPHASLSSGSFVATVHADEPDNQWHSGGRLPKGIAKGAGADGIYRTNKSETAALADFLKNTAPPPAPAVSTMSSVSGMKTGSSGGWTFKTFLRKKKQVV
ncbi:uncharacterized protein GIQ15_01299 [Arthroderma uncinatum]|uniref:uncharacterized protein n=1 Tax=Arthroderma uncinatum TaxID=74035 RepID=UPI00144AB0BD|nr:uncharacterized protein GIQ15_01299 [Arthroderma uncinatum]KAF3491782.1 hypothetical protein GIQ15_01299 [Arthroderma uncinatum]